MKFRTYGMLTASVGVIALTLGASDTFAAPRGAASHGVSASTHSRQLAARWFRHHRRAQAGSFWGWGDDDSFGSAGYGAAGDGPLGGAPPVPGDIHYTQTYDVPWDWAHRFPPAVAPSEHPYVSNCPAETVTVPDGHGGKGEVNIIRCY